VSGVNLMGFAHYLVNTELGHATLHTKHGTNSYRAKSSQFLLGFEASVAARVFSSEPLPLAKMGEVLRTKSGTS
jgi:hypothetical protein